MSTTTASTESPARPRKRRFYKSLIFWILVGLVAGILVGATWPTFGASLKILGDNFINLIKMLIAPLVFCVVVLGIAGAGDLVSLRRIGIKALVYFEVVTTAALIIGLGMALWLKPGAGLNVDPSTLDTSALDQETAASGELTVSSFILGIIPESVVDAFATNNLLQILLFAVLFGIAMIILGERCSPLLTMLENLQDVVFKIVDWVMRLAPIATFGVVAYVTGEYGLESLLSFGKLILVFFAVVIAVLALFAVILGVYLRINLLRVLNYFREEIITAAALGSSEAMLPRIVEKLKKCGCSSPVVGIVVPSGYSFNLDGATAYLSVAIIFLAQVSGADLSFSSVLTIVLVSMLTSKGMAGVAGSSFVALLATLSAVGGIPAALAVIILGPDQIMGKGRTMVNIIGTLVATIVVARWTNELDVDVLRRELRRRRSGLPAEDESNDVIKASATADNGNPPGEAPEATTGDNAGTAAVFSPSQPPDHATTLRHWVRNELWARIADGRLAPGQRLYEKAIADGLSVSRVPVREALRALEAQGYVESAPSGGMIVRPLTLEEVNEMFDVRGAIDSLAARLAAQNVTSETISAFDALLVQSRAALGEGSRGHLGELNRMFHRTVREASENRIIVERVEPLVSRLSFVFQESTDPELVVRLHEDLVSALRRHDPAAAMKVAEMNNEHNRSVALDYFKEAVPSH